jgi:hypothetical protein
MSKVDFLLWGVVLVFLGALILWRTNRYDIRGWMWDSAWQVARRKRTPTNPTVLEAKLDKIMSEKSAIGRARTTAGYVVGHLVAQLLGLVAGTAILIGVALVVYGLLWA